MNRIQVNKRRFGYKAGLTFLGVKEYPKRECRCGHDVETHGVYLFDSDDFSMRCRVCECGEFRVVQLLSFAIPRPDAIDRKQIRALILQKMGASTRECEK